MDTKEQYDKIVENIKDVLETYVQPAVAGHGGKVNYLDYDNGAVTLEMSGACYGCAMSSMTLKMGIENILIEMVPEVVTVHGVDDPNSGVDPYMNKDYGYDPGQYWDNIEDQETEFKKSINPNLIATDNEPKENT